MTGKYGLAAIAAVNLVRDKVINDPRKAWKEAVNSHSKKEYDVKNKSGPKECPTGTFLGLCEEGLINGIPKGYYTNSKKNKAYGIAAVEILKKNPSLANNKDHLWKLIPNKTATYQNCQLDVVIALWNEGMIR